ncbi:ATP-binding protein [Actinoplanes philippinensis]|nr:hypothetical protein [Actinoplanes philippinensis]
MPGFTVTAGNADAIRRLCRTLDGLPLAVELAAARLHALPVTEIAARLDDRFRLLSGGSRTAAGRHRSLQAVVAWSWDLLTEPERVLARRFTVFTGGAGLDAVERVCGAGPDAVVDVLAGLVAKSLIERDGDRYRMLETIRAFCAERLAESREQERMHRVHAEYFLELAARADPYLRGFDQIAWLDRLDNDRDNLHAAIRRSVAQGAAPTALRLVAALSFYWWLRGLRSEAATLADLTLRGAGPEPPAGHVEEYVLGVFTAALGNGDRTARPAARWADYMRTLTAAPAHPFLLYLSAMAVGPPAGDPAGIMELNRRLRAQIAGDPWSQALGGIGAGWMVMFSGSDPELAGPEFRSSLDGFRALGDRWGTMLALSGLAELAAWRGDPAAAIAPTAEALELARELGSTIDVADLLRGRAQARMDTGDIAGAAADFTRVAELARSAGAPELVAAALLGLGSLALARVAPAPATSSAHTAPLPAASSRGAGSSPPTRAPSSASADAARSSAAGTGSLPPAEAEQGTAFLPPAEAEQGTAFLPPAGAEQGTAARGDAGREALAEALRYCHEALAACPAGWYSADGTRMTILVMLGRIAELSGDRAAAQARYREVFTVRAGMLGFQVMAEALDRLAGLAVTAGDPDRAARLLGAGTALGLRAGPEASEPGRTAASAARAVLGPHRFAEALARGAGLTPDEAVDLSLAPF